MIKDLQSIFNSITPDNIAEIPVIKDAMGIFIETLEDLSSESIDIKNIYTNNKIKEELIKIYLDDLYTVLKEAQFSNKLLSEIDRINAIYNAGTGAKIGDPNYIEYYKRDVISNITDHINEEHFVTFKSFKQKKGTEAAIRYIYDLLSVFFVSEMNNNVFSLIEGEPFHFDILASLPGVFYEYIIHPLAHPLGFTYTYTRYMDLVLTDYFPELKRTYTVLDLEVRCLHPDGTTTSYDFSDRTVVNVETVLEGTSRIKNIYFDNGEYLKQTTTSVGQTYVVHYDSDDEILTTFADQCSIYFNYDFSLDTTIADEVAYTYSMEKPDYFSRLDISLNIPVIGGYSLINYPELLKVNNFYIFSPERIHNMDFGFNERLNRDGDYVLGIDDGRWENAFAPSYEADLKLLSGKYVKNYEVIDPETEEVIYIQPIKYTDTVVPEYVMVSRVNTLENFINENIGNEKYTAREHSFIDLETVEFVSQNYFEIPYIETTPFIDFNGENRGDFLGALNLIGDGKVIGPYTIGTGIDYNNNLTSIYDENPNFSVFHFVTKVNAEPINLQYNTWDVFDCGVYRNEILLADNNISAL